MSRLEFADRTNGACHEPVTVFMLLCGICSCDLLLDVRAVSFVVLLSPSSVVALLPRCHWKKSNT